MGPGPQGPTRVRRRGRADGLADVARRPARRAPRPCARGSKMARIMRGDSEIIELLNEVLTSELTAINQYFIHYRMLENFGFAVLAKKKKEESIEEMHHADQIISRILFL